MDEVPREGGDVTPSDAGPASQPRVFINYRHEDTAGEALLLYTTLVERFGPESVFLDVRSLTAGAEWLKEIRGSGGRGGAFLALIGTQWLGSLQARRAARVEANAAHEDYVCREIEWALRDWPGQVIPVLVGTSMPDDAKLPRSIRAITAKHAFELRHSSFDPDVARLIEAIEGQVASRGGPSDDRSELVADPPLETGLVIEELDDIGPGHNEPEGAGILPSGITAPGKDHYELVAMEMLHGTVVPILGSHVFGTIPDAGELASYIAAEYGLPQLGSNADLAEVAQYVAVTVGEGNLRKAVRKALRERQPTPVHRFLARLPKALESLGVEPMYQLIITSNYDDALERAFEDEHEPFDLAVYMAQTSQFVHYPWRSEAGDMQGIPITTPNTYDGFPIDPDEGELEHTVIVKIHGGTDVSTAQSNRGEDYVLTEDQYIDYLPNDDIRSVVPIQVLNKLRDSHNLFLGYRMRNWNERIFLRRLWHTYPLSERSWAIEGNPDVFERDGWGMTPIQLFGCALSAYVEQLEAALDSRRMSHV
jgi:hypothetical protein